MNTGSGIRADRVAIIGGGISGMGAALALEGQAEIILFEASDQLGGHAQTVTAQPQAADGQSLSIPCDIGFIVYNRQNYPLLQGLFKYLDIQTRPTKMTFAVSNADQCVWSSLTGAGYLRWPRIWPLIAEILAFNKKARADLASAQLDGVSLGDWLERAEISNRLRDQYLLPLTAAVWSSALSIELARPVLPLLRFMDNHRLLHVKRPHWRTVIGGSRMYVSAVAQRLQDRVRLSSPVRRIERSGQGLNVITNDEIFTFDAVIMACHADQARALLPTESGQAFATQRAALSDIGFQSNQAVLHTDTGWMPPQAWQWAAWNVRLDPQAEGAQHDKVCVTYWLNLLQGLDRQYPLFLTLNPPQDAIAQSAILGRYDFAHPVPDSGAYKAVQTLKSLQGQEGLWLAGAWMGDGFHEDGLKSGLEAACALGGQIPWAAKA